MSQHIYTYDPTNNQLNEIGGAGHIIKNESGTALTKRENLQFEGMDVSDDSTNNATVVKAVETNFVGTWTEWNALTLAERAQYKTVDLTDDFNGDPIDAVPTANSSHAVSSGGTYTALQNKQDSPTILTSTLSAGATTLTFTDSSITNSSMIDVYTDDPSLEYTSITQSGTTVTVTFEEQSSSVTVKLVVRR